MAAPAITYRTDDNTRWGTGKGANLTPAQVDINMWELAQAIISLQDNPVQPKEIDQIVVSGDQMTITLSDGVTEFGPFTLPTISLNPTGAFQTGHEYSKNDLLTASEGLYLVLQDHTSASTFDPDASNMSGDLYGFLMPFPTSYDLGVFIPGQPGSGIVSGEPIYAFCAARAFTFVAGLTASRAQLGDGTTDAMTLTMRKNGVAIGTINFGAGAQIGTFTLAADVSFAAGDVFDIVRPTTLDSTARNLMLTLIGRRD